MTNYSVGDFLIKVKNAAMAKNKDFETEVNNQVLAVAQSLKKLGYLSSVTVNKTRLTGVLTYKNKRPVVIDIKLVSKPGLRIYMGASDIEKKKGPSIYLLTSPKGIISSREAVKQRVGGEIIAEIW